MAKDAARTEIASKLTQELRRGLVVLAAISQLEKDRYGYSLQQRLADRGFEIEQGTLYPLLRRLDEQGVLASEWTVEGSRPRKYYRLSQDGERVLAELTENWRRLVAVVDSLLEKETDDE